MRSGARIAIVGENAHAWTAAAMLAHALRIEQPSIRVFPLAEESASSPVVSLSPAAARHLRTMGVEFEEIWTKTRGGMLIGMALSCAGRQPAMVSFETGPPLLNGVAVHHYLRRQSEQFDIAPFSLAATALAEGRLPDLGHHEKDGMPHGFHVHERWYRDTMRSLALSHGVLTSPKPVLGVQMATHTHPANLQVSALETEDQAYPVDFVFDLSASRLVAGRLEKDFYDWSSWIPLRSRRIETIPESGVVDCAERWTLTDSDLVGEIQQAEHCVRISYLPGSSGTGSSLTPGRPARFWSGNCVALGAAAGFCGDWILGTIHQVQSGLLRWLGLRPRSTESGPILAAEYDRLTGLESECLRDLHAAVFAAGRPTDLPESLAHRLSLYRASGRIALFEGESVAAWTWVQVWTALGIFPEKYDALADRMPDSALASELARLSATVSQTVASWPARTTPPNRSDSA